MPTILFEVRVPNQKFLTTVVVRQTASGSWTIYPIFSHLPDDAVLLQWQEDNEHRVYWPDVKTLSDLKNKILKSNATIYKDVHPFECQECFLEVWDKTGFEGYKP